MDEDTPALERPARPLECAVADPRALVAGQLREQALSCEQMGSPLYGRLLRAAAEDAESGGPTWSVLEPHVAPGRGNALALRLMAAAHRLVLTGRASPLAAHYPSVGGDAGRDGAWEALRDLLAREGDAIRALVVRPCQTNEVGRCAPLLFGFLETAARTRRPFRLLEVGASAGLNLRWDRFRYGGAGASWGPPDSPVDLSGFWAEAPPFVETPIEVVDRRGCDLSPLDPGREEDRLTLQASVWADQTARLARLRGALELAARVPATVEAASLHEWLPAQLAQDCTGVATVVYHSVVDEYLPHDARQAFHATLDEAGARATADAPLAWVRLEPASSIREHAVTLRLWPGGEERRLALAGAHGTGVRRTP
jgi:hypothetical protein